MLNFDLENIKKAQCLKITEKVSFNIASEASYVYFLSGQKLIKNAKNGAFMGQTVSLIIGQKLVGKCQN